MSARVDKIHICFLSYLFKTECNKPTGIIKPLAYGNTIICPSLQVDTTPAQPGR